MVTPAIPAACTIISEIAVEWTRSETSMVKTMAAVRIASEMTTTKTPAANGVTTTTREMTTAATTKMTATAT